MSFLNPIFLMGILAAGIPVIIHLLNKKQTAVYRQETEDTNTDIEEKGQERVDSENGLKNLSGSSGLNGLNGLNGFMATDKGDQPQSGYTPSKTVSSINIIDTSESLQLDNICISNVEAKEETDTILNGFKVRLSINNYSPLPISELIARVYLNDELSAQGFVTIGPWSSESKEFFCKTAGPGLVKGRVEIGGGGSNPIEPLDIDNVRYFIFDVERDINMLIVDGAPDTNLYKSETFYIENALRRDAGITSHIRPQVSNIYEFEGIKLDDFDMIILCNVESLTDSKIHELERFVEKGGLVFFTLGDKVRPAYYNSYFRNLLPCSLHGIKEFDDESGPIMTNPSENLDFSDSSLISLKRPEDYQPFIDIFSDLSEKDINSVRFRKIFLVSPQLNLPDRRAKNSSYITRTAHAFKTDAGSVLLRFSNNMPAIIAKRIGSGMVVLFTSTIDRDWNNLAIRPIFLPLIQQICKDMTSSALVEGYKTNILVDEKWDLPWPYLLPGEDMDIARIINPDKDIDILYPFGSDEMGISQYTKTLKPGIYSLEVGNNPSISSRAAFAVNINPAESNLMKIDRDKLMKLLGKWDVNLVSNNNYEGIIYGKGLKKSLWIETLFLALCLLCIEAVIVWRRK